MAPFRNRTGRCLTAALSLALLALGACSHTKPAPPDVPASALQAFRRGVDAYREEDYEHAARLFELAASKDDRNATIQYNLGLAYYMLEAYPESIEAYQKCLKLDPKFADAHMNLALAYDRTYDLDQANAHYNAYLALVHAERVNGSATPVAAGTPSGSGVSAGRVREAQQQSSQAARTAQQGTGQASGEISQGAPGARKSKPRPALVLGGEPLSSLPGGNLARYKGDPHPASVSRAGQAAYGQPFAGGREPAGAARRVPSELAERLREVQKQQGHGTQTTPSRPDGATFSSTDPWWTQEALPQTP